MPRTTTRRTDDTEAVDTLLVDLQEAIENAAGNRAPDVEDAITAFRAAVSGDFTDAIGVVGGIPTAYSRVMDRGGLDSGAKMSARGQLAGVLVACDRTLASGSTDETRLHQAQSHLADVEAQLTNAVAGLEQAVTDADVEAIMRLRTTVEAVLPGVVAKAKLAVVEAELEIAKALVVAPSERVRAARVVAEEAEAAWRRAEDAVPVAAEHAQRKYALVSLAEQVATQRTAEVDRLKTQRKALANDAEHGQTARLRRLAGLPERVSA